MSTRTDILAALRTDLEVTGMQKVWKSIQRLDKIPDDLLPSFCVKFGTAVNTPTSEGLAIWELPVMVVVYFKCGNDTTNQGLLETEAEDLIELFLNVQFAETSEIDEVRSMEIMTITPYIDTGIENRGFLYLEYKLNYIGD
jgi:hypothetical protein